MTRMMGDTHRQFGAAAWFGVCDTVLLHPDLIGWTAARPDTLTIVWGAVLCSAMSGGWLSPDGDQHRFLKWLIPGGHRGPTHCPDLVGFVAYALIHWSWGTPSQFPTLAVCIAWGGHIAADALFGGVPFLLLGGRRRYGLHLDTGGIFERIIVAKWLPIAAVVLGAVAVFASAGLDVTDGIAIGYRTVIHPTLAAVWTATVTAVQASG